jgi:hypothetical protein
MLAPRHTHNRLAAELSDVALCLTPAARNSDNTGVGASKRRLLQTRVGRHAFLHAPVAAHPHPLGIGGACLLVAISRRAVILYRRLPLRRAGGTAHQPPDTPLIRHGAAGHLCCAPRTSRTAQGRVLHGNLRRVCERTECGTLS